VDTDATDAEPGTAVTLTDTLAAHYDASDVLTNSALLDDRAASATQPTSRLYTGYAHERRCTDPATLDAVWAEVCADHQQGLHALLLIDYEWGAGLLGAGRREAEPQGGQTDAGIAAAEPDAEQLAADGATAAEPSAGAGTSAAPAKPDAGPVATPAAETAVAAAPAAAPAPAAAKAVAPPEPAAPPAAKPAPVAAPAPKPAPVAKAVPDAPGPSLSEAEALEAELRAAMPLEGPGAPRQAAEPVRPAPEAAATAPAPAKPKPAVKPAPQPAPKVAPKAAPKAAAPSGDYVYRGGNRAGGALTADEQYLVGQPAGNFVLQIMGSDDPARVRSFIARAGVPLRVYRKLNNGKEWYSVVYGNYASRAAADKAQKNLPRGLAGSKPWVRRLDAVQKEIRAARAL
jgi:hypothetical protein